MQFNKLRVTGFKSFVDTVEFSLADGTTGVIGPNGCGKSNIVDALRWVMGENRSKQMRGAAMDDVIFSGTAHRPQRNLAEVVIEIDNSDRTAPAQFNETDQLAVSRRIERDGGSTFRVNGKEVRARDVQMLFADASSGAHSTAIVSQGRIASLISARPTERRLLIEEAAGITGLHSRRHEASLRLRGAEQNLERLDDVGVTLDAQLVNIKRQARQANRYRRIATQLRKFEAIVWHLRYSAADAAFRQAEIDRDEAERLVAARTADVANATAAAETASTALPDLRTAESVAAAILQRLNIARDGLDREEQSLKEQQAAVATQRQDIEADIDRGRMVDDDADAATRRLAAERDALLEAGQDDDSRVAAAVAALEAAQAQLKAAEHRLDAAMEAISHLKARQQSLQQEETNLGRSLERLQARKDKLSDEARQVTALIQDDRRLADARNATESREQTLTDGLAALERAESEQRLAREAEREAEAGLSELRNAHARLAAEENALSELLSVHAADRYPPLVDAVTVENGYEQALGAALGEELNSSTDVESPVHWATLPPLSDLPPLPAGTRALSDFVAAPPALNRRLRSIGVIDDAADGGRIASDLKSGQRLVSRDGALWRWDGYRIAAGAETAAAARLRQRNRLADVIGELKDLAPAKEAAETARDAARNRMSRADSAAGEARKLVRDAEKAARDAQHDLQRQERTAGEMQTRLTGIETALAELAPDLTETTERAAQVSQSLADLPPLDRAEQDIDRQRATVGELRLAFAEAKSTETERRREADNRRQRLQAIENETAEWRSRRENAAKQLEILESRLAATVETQEQLARKPAQLHQQRHDLMQQIDSAEQERKTASDALAAAETLSRDRDTGLKQAEHLLSDAREQRGRREAALEQAEERGRDIVKLIAEALETTPEAVLEAGGVAADEELPALEQAETRLERLKKERDNIGPVNLRAEQEAEELEEQIQTMQTERADLEAAIARLRQGIASLNREGRERLLAAMTTVNGHFQTLFRHLFGGGEASIRLVGDDDPLEAGLEILASPPGKKLQSLSLLSGGEQTLTALSLLFAVFRTNPAPLCTLDEVDAPLDDSNVERFCNLLDDIARETGTRFVIVTHHPYTMARMNRLFGVTMAEKGVSQLVSVDLDRQAPLQAAG